MPEGAPAYPEEMIRPSRARIAPTLRLPQVDRRDVRRAWSDSRSSREMRFISRLFDQFGNSGER
jgi:hypothetical protein